MSFTAIGGGIAHAGAAPSPQEPLTWMSTQSIQIGEYGPTVSLGRQVGNECIIIAKSATTTTVECNDIEMALVGSMVELHMNNTVTVDVTETKTGSINNALDYRTSDPYTFHGKVGSLAPGAHEHFATPDLDRPDWYLGLDGKLGNSGTARIVLIYNE